MTCKCLLDIDIRCAGCPAFDIFCVFLMRKVCLRCLNQKMRRLRYSENDTVIFANTKVTIEAVLKFDCIFRN